jgi:hypothetical protein
MAKGRHKHGHTPFNVRPPPEYRAWQGMKKRCFNRASRDFRDYGGRGITVAPEWLNDFAAFLRDMGARPSPRHSLDRITEQQARNSRRTKLSDEIVATIRAQAKDGTPRRELWERYGITKTHLNRVIRGSAWGIPRAHRVPL